MCCAASPLAGCRILACPAAILYLACASASVIPATAFDYLGDVHTRFVQTGRLPLGVPSEIAWVVVAADTLYVVDAVILYIPWFEEWQEARQATSQVQPDDDGKEGSAKSTMSPAVPPASAEQGV